MSLPNELISASLGGGAADTDYQIQRSLRFNSADSSHLSKTFSSAGNRKTWTWSGWVKRSELTTDDARNYLFSAPDSGGHCSFYFSADKLRQNPYTAANGSFTTDAVFRDTSAWYHIVYTYDSTQSTATDRIKLYVNGVLQTFSAYSAPTRNQDSPFSAAAAHYIGKHATASTYSNFYLADVHFVDGQALASTDFGEPDDNNVWQAKEYEGTYNTPATSGVINTLEFTGNGPHAFHAIRVDGTILTGADYTNGVLGSWSSNVTNPGGSFDGILTGGNVAYSNNGSAITWTSNGGLSYNSQVEIYVGNISPFNVNINGGGAFSVTRNAWSTIAEVPTAGVNGFHLDFSDNSTAAALGTDTSGEGNDWTVNNLTAESPLSLPGVDFDGSDLLTVPSFTTAPQGTNDFTVEFYAWFDFGSNSSIKVVTWAAETSHPNYRIAVQVENGKYYIVDAANYGASYYSSKNDLSSYTSVVAPSKKWHHVAVQRASGVDTIYVDGQVQFTASGHTASSSSVTGNWTIGGGQDNTSHMIGKLSNFRVLDGTALYSSAFTPPTTPLTNITNTVLLCCQSGSIANAAAVSTGTLTTTGDPTAVTFSDSTEANDSLVDTPTNYGNDTGAGGEVRGNYAKLNPLTASSAFTLSNGNLDVSDSGASSSVLLATIGVNSGKWYWEVTLGNNTAYVGAAQVTSRSSVAYLGQTTGQFMYNTSVPSSSWINGSNYNYSTGVAATTNDVIGVALDFDANTITYYKNGTSLGTFGSNVLGTSTWAPAFKSNHSSSAVFNFGQRPFAYTAPSGYKALNTASLPEPTIADGSAYMDVALYDGSGSTQSITGLAFSPDFVWTKPRSQTNDHVWTDSVRGPGERLFSNTIGSESTQATSLTSFNSDGFTLGSHSSINNGSHTYVAWTWDAGANSSKTYAVTVVSDSGNKYRFDGHGTSAVTLDLEEGSTYTFDQSDSSNAGHPLRFSTTSNGTHGGGSEYTTGVVTNGTPGSAGAYTKITIASGAPTLYYYCSVHSGMGGQVNTNSTAGATVLSGSLNSSLYNQSQTWSSSLSTNDTLQNATNAFDGSTTTRAQTANAAANKTITFAPAVGVSFTTSLEVYCDQGNSTPTATWNGNTVNPGSGAWVTVYSGSGTISSSTPLVIDTESAVQYATLKGIRLDGKILVDSSVSITTPSINSVVRANPAAGFSIVTWTGTANATVGHGLNAAPKLVITKSRSNEVAWRIWSSEFSNLTADYLGFNTGGAATFGGTYWGSMTPTTIGLGAGTYDNNYNDMVAFCFTPVEGFSSIGSYVGNGLPDGPFVFTGMRPKWLMIKAISSVSYGNWVIHDTERSTFNVSNTNLYANLTNSEDTTYAIDFLSNGFKIRNSAYDAHNGSGETYIYYAVAENPFSLNGGLAR